MKLLPLLNTVPDSQDSLTMEQTASRLERTVPFVGRMVEVGELRPLPGKPLRFSKIEVARAKEQLERRRRAIEEVHRIDVEEREANGMQSLS